MQFIPCIMTTISFSLLLILQKVASEVTSNKQQQQQKQKHPSKTTTKTTTTRRTQNNNIAIPEWGIPYEVGGEAGVDFMYEGVYWQFPETGGSGLSYYLRAFDMFPTHYANELGWGQWIGGTGENPNDGPCPLNPRMLACIDPEIVEDFYEGNNPGNYEEELKDCTWPEDDDRLLQCKIDTCGWTDDYPIFGQFEGGVGYWPYVTESSGVKWGVPGAVSGYYNKFGTAFLNDQHQPCTNLGGAIQISNNILLAPDAYSFEPGEDGSGVDGMIGYMLQNTPIGKMHPDDNRNYWTIVVDTENFAGPLSYSSAYHWEHPNSWRPDIRTWADPDVKLGGGSEGIEGRVGTTVVETDEYYWFRIQDVDMHLDRDGDALTITTNHVRYDSDWQVVLEAALDGSRPGMGPSDIREAAANAGTKPPCFARGDEGELGQFKVTGELPEGVLPFTEYTVSGWGVGDSTDIEDQQDTDDAWCHTKIPIDTSNPNMVCDTNKCSLTPYHRLPKDGSSSKAELIPVKDMPSDIKMALDERSEDLFEDVKRWNSGEYLDFPDADQEACFDNPGPSDPKLYCRRTTDERWLAYRWYRFVDQPELNQVIGSLPQDQQEETKCFMQARIERLHRMQAKESNPRWFEPPAELPTDRVKLDQGYIVTPPAGFEIGYVPVSVYSKLRTKPSNCDVTEGEFDTEPDPLPADYFTTPDGFGSDYQRYVEVCAPTIFSGDTYEVPGTIYVSAIDGSGDKYPWKVPLRKDVGNFIPKAYDAAQCSLSGGPPSSAPTNAPVVTPFCFSETNTVEVYNKGTIQMNQLQIGDRVLTSSNIYETVYSFGHYDPTREAEFIKITTDSSNDALEISKKHMLFVNGKAIPASLVKIGDLLSTTDPNTATKVEKIEVINRKGVYAPFTSPSGTILVNGVLASSFIAFQESDVLTVGGIRTPFTFQGLAHSFEAPHRAICSMFPDWCQKEQYASNGMSLWVYVPFYVTEWMFSNFLVKASPMQIGPQISSRMQ